MYALKLNANAGEWQKLEIPGVSMMVLRNDDRTGGMVVLTRLAAGATIPAHSHSKADESVFVLDGDFVEDGESFGPGGYFFGASGTVHGPHTTVGGCTVITHFSAAFDFLPVE